MITLVQGTFWVTVHTMITLFHGKVWLKLYAMITLVQGTFWVKVHVCIDYSGSRQVFCKSAFTNYFGSMFWVKIHHQAMITLVQGKVWVEAHTSTECYDFSDLNGNAGRHVVSLAASVVRHPFTTQTMAACHLYANSPVIRNGQPNVRLRSNYHNQYWLVWDAWPTYFVHKSQFRRCLNQWNK